MLAIPFKIETHEELRSTQDAMRDRLEATGAVHGLVIRAKRQSGGRGQRARDWESGEGGSYQTLAVRDTDPPTLKRRDAALAVAVGLAEVLPTYGVQVGIKWPNDLYYRGKKLAGILTEYTHGHLLVGVGMNVNNDVPEGAIGLKGWDLEGVHAIVLEGVQQGLELLASRGNVPARFAPHDLLQHREVTVSFGAATRSGTARGITESGCLRLEQTDGTVQDICEGHLAHFSFQD